MSERLTFAATVQTEGRNIRGSVLLAGQKTPRANGEYVRVDPAALIKADTTGLFASMEHDDRALLGSVANGTLTLNRTEQGFDYLISNVPNTTAGNDALELIRSGEVRGSSFEIFGMHSSFETDPTTGARTRVYDRIKNFISISPVRDPAFPSTSAAFSKENEVPDNDTAVVEAPKAPPANPEPPKAQFTEKPKSGKEAWAKIAESASVEQITATMDNLFAQTKGELKGDQLDQYEAFNDELQSRKQKDALDRARAEQLQARHNFAMGRVPKAPASDEVYASDDYIHAFDSYMRSDITTFARNVDRMLSFGPPSPTPGRFAQTVAGDGTQGGFTVPDGFVNKITMRMKAYGGIASAAQEFTTANGESVRWPYIDDTANKAQIVAEDTQATQGADLVFDSIELGAYEYDATGPSGTPIEVSLTLLQDSAFDIEALLEKALGQRIGRKQADNFATGTGVNEPVGLFTKTADVMSATVSSLAAVEQVFQIDSDYRDNGNVRWIMSDTTLAKLWGAQSTTNEPLFMPNRVINGTPFNTLMGYPISIDPAAGNLVAFGDIEQGYIIRRVRGVQLLVDPYTANVRRAVRYHAWARADANIQDPNAYSVSTWASVSADT